MYRFAVAHWQRKTMLLGWAGFAELWSAMEQRKSAARHFFFSVLRSVFKCWVVLFENARRLQAAVRHWCGGSLGRALESWCRLIFLRDWKLGAIAMCEKNVQMRACQAWRVAVRVRYSQPMPAGPNFYMLTAYISPPHHPAGPAGEDAQNLQIGRQTRAQRSLEGLHAGAPPEGGVDKLYI